MSQSRRPQRLIAYVKRVAYLWLSAGLLFNFIAIRGQIKTEKVDLVTIDLIKDEELKRSQIMEIAGYLTDVTGPRLTGSPNLRKAQEYAKNKLNEWGIQNAHLEPWGPFGRGWSLEGFTANIIAPAFSPLIATGRAGFAGCISREMKPSNRFFANGSRRLRTWELTL